jgi:hypothetical protein
MRIDNGCKKGGVCTSQIEKVVCGKSPSIYVPFFQSRGAFGWVSEQS